MHRHHILFVDDEPNVLEGLQRMLRGMQPEWDLHFANSGAEALSILSAQPMDVVVTDMRMPVMNGAQLLEKVMKSSPNTIRMILSGHADQTLILKTTGVAQQFLSKPCEPETLKSTIRKATSLRALLTDGDLKQVISQMGKMPSLPHLYMRVVEQLNSPDASIQEIGELISQDLGMTAKILQIVNSGFFGIRRRISNPVEATSYLGLDRIQMLFLSVQAFSEFKAAASSHFSPEKLWKHSLATATIGKKICESETADKKMAEQCYTAGLLHDLGSLMIAARLPDKVRESAQFAREHCVPAWEAERAVLGASHSDVGAYLLGLWGLPDGIVEAILFHHCPSAYGSPVFSPLAVVHVADALDHESDPEPGKIPASSIDTEFLTRAGVSGRLDYWRRIKEDVVATTGAAK